MRLSSGLTLILLLALLAGLTLLPAVSNGVAGRVLDADGPVAGARVRRKGTPAVTRTDAHGRFRSPLPASARRVTAWKEGHFIGGSRRGSSPLSIWLTRLPAEDNAAYEWVDPAPNAAEVGNCANCHAEIYREWSHSGHSRSVNGRHFRNLYEGTDWNGEDGVGWGLLTQYPEGSGVCASLSCAGGHAVRSASGQGRGRPRRPLRLLPQDRRHSRRPHRAITWTVQPAAAAPTEGQLFFGALDDVDRGEDAYSPLYRDSRYCASCHEGVVFGVHVYSTFSEWQTSPAAARASNARIAT